MTQDEAEVARMEKTIEVCKKTLIDLGHAEFTFEDFLGVSDYPLGLYSVIGHQIGAIGRGYLL